MKIVKNSSKNWEDKQGYSKKIFLTPEEIHSPGNLLQEVKIKTGETAANHYHKVQTEIFYFLNDAGYWIINGTEYRFKTGDILVIEPGDKHTVLNESDVDYNYLAFKVNFAENDFYWVD